MTRRGVCIVCDDEAVVTMSAEGDGFICADCAASRRAHKYCDAENAALRAKYDLANRLVNRLPLCQDHRDKFSPEQCQACRAERAERQVAALRTRAEGARNTLARIAAGYYRENPVCTGSCGFCVRCVARAELGRLLAPSPPPASEPEGEGRTRRSG